MRDWEIHLSTVFPEVRLKRYIELRGADAGPMPMAAALGALWRGLLDDHDARAAAWELVAGHSFAEREALRREVPRAALQARFGGQRPAGPGAGAVRISDAGLARLPGGEDDRPLLAPLWGYAAAGRTPADDMLDDYEAVSGDPAKLVATLGAAAVGPPRNPLAASRSGHRDLTSLARLRERAEVRIAPGEGAVRGRRPG